MLGRKDAAMEGATAREKVCELVARCLPEREIESDWRTRWLLLAVHMASLVAFGFVAFQANEAQLFPSLDGSYMMALAKQQAVWMPWAAGFSSNFFQSLGNMWFPINTHFIPGYILSLQLYAGEINPVISYVIFSVELFLSVYLLSAFLRFNAVVSGMASWGLVLTLMP